LEEGHYGRKKAIHVVASLVVGHNEKRFLGQRETPKGLVTLHEDNEFPICSSNWEFGEGALIQNLNAIAGNQCAYLSSIIPDIKASCAFKIAYNLYNIPD
jgi:hypothetical protein